MPALCKSSLRMRDITWPVPLSKIWVHILVSRPHIAYSLWHFYWAPMKNKGCLLVRPPNVKREIERKFCPDENWANFGGFGVFGVRGFKKLRFLPPKGTSLREPTSFEPLCVKIGRWVTSRLVEEKKSESHRDSHRKDMSPLTQGLNYRSACDDDEG